MTTEPLKQDNDDDSQDYTWKAKISEDKVETNGVGFWAVQQGEAPLTESEILELNHQEELYEAEQLWESEG